MRSQVRTTGADKFKEVRDGLGVMSVALGPNARDNAVGGGLPKMSNHEQADMQRGGGTAHGQMQRMSRLWEEIIVSNISNRNWTLAGSIQAGTSSGGKARVGTGRPDLLSCCGGGGEGEDGEGGGTHCERVHVTLRSYFSRRKNGPLVIKQKERKR